VTGFFAKYDTDKDGKISQSEMKVALIENWPTVTDNQVETVIKKMDTDGNGLISQEEMLKSTIAEQYADGKIKSIEEVAPPTKPVEPVKPVEPTPPKEESNGIPPITWGIFISGAIFLIYKGITWY